MKFFKGEIFPRLIAAFPLIFPLYLIRGELFSVPFTLPEILLGFAFVFFILREEIWRISWWRKHGYRWKHLAIFLFLTAAILGVLVTPDISYMAFGAEFPAKIKALGIFKGWVLAPMIYFFMARTYFYEKPSLIPFALRSLLLSGVFLSLQALYQLASGDFTTPDGRASGPFESANYLALYLGPIAVYAFLTFARERQLFWRVFLGISLLICLGALYATLSYAAWIAVAVALFAALFVHSKKLPKRVQAGILAGIVLVLGLALVSQLGTDKFEQFLDFSGRSSSTVRLQVYEISLNLIKQHPFLGIGLGQFEQVYQVNAVNILGHDPFEWNMLHPHNIFLALWLNMGLMGLLAFLWLCLKAFAWILEQDKREHRIAALMLVAILVHGLFDVPYFKNDLAFQFWLLIAILL